LKIYFVEVESSERRFFESELANHELHFVSSLEEVERDQRKETREGVTARAETSVLERGTTPLRNPFLVDTSDPIWEIHWSEC
jgi:hypothetical protein